MRRDGTVLGGVGAVAGLLSALFGVGGGTIIVPALIARGWQAHRATATSLAAIGATAVFGTLRYAWDDLVVWRDAALIGLPAVVGVVFGTALAKRVRGPHLQMAFACVMLLVAGRLAW
ncbi:MAG TPA: sulfite exporter TauE/SafE family protein [Gaiellales bacterium]|nr:sulfite exporter TauE/SafE family protein [Gaiellales bacterium]